MNNRRESNDISIKDENNPISLKAITPYDPFANFIKSRKITPAITKKQVMTPEDEDASANYENFAGYLNKSKLQNHTAGKLSHRRNIRRD